MQNKPIRPITLRNIPPDLAKRIRKLAEKEGASLNKTVLSVLARSLGTAKPSKRLHRDLDRFIGSWSAEEAAQFIASIEEQRQIDSEVWE